MSREITTSTKISPTENKNYSSYKGYISHCIKYPSNGAMKNHQEGQNKRPILLSSTTSTSNTASSFSYTRPKVNTSVQTKTQNSTATQNNKRPITFSVRRNSRKKGD